MGAVFAGVVALHGPVAVQVPHRLTKAAPGSVWMASLRGEDPLPLRWRRQPWHAWQKGTAEGYLLGGNLSLLSTLVGTSLDYRHFGRPALLFWEECRGVLLSTTGFQGTCGMQGGFHQSRGSPYRGPLSPPDDEALALQPVLEMVACDQDRYCIECQWVT